MAETIKEKIKDAGHAIADTAKDVGHKIGEKAEQAADWVKEKTHMGGTSCGKAGNAGLVGIRDHMDVIASCGTKIGTVDHRDGDSIKLTKSGSPDGQHHFIPANWVDHVDNHVHLNKNSEEAKPRLEVRFRRMWCLCRLMESARIAVQSWPALDGERAIFVSW